MQNMSKVSAKKSKIIKKLYKKNRTDDGNRIISIVFINIVFAIITTVILNY